MRLSAARTMMGGGVLPVLLVVWMGGGGVAAGGTRGTGTGTGTTSTSGALYEMLDMCVAGFAGLLHVRAEVKTLDLQTFSSALAGIACEPITTTDDVRRPYAVGSDTFTDYASAAVRTCNNQKNKCAEVANQGGGGSPVTLEDCNEQEEKCTSNAVTTDPSTIGVAPPPQATPAPPSRSFVEEASPISPPPSSPPAADPPTVDSPTADSPAADPPAAERPSGNSPAAERPSGNSPAADPPAAHSPAADPPAADPPAHNPPAADSPAHNPPAHNPPAADPPAPVLPAPPNRLASAELLKPTLHSSDAEFFYFCDP
ncbi:uncharacterized protein L3040_001116 [Drepanopeziza brunnea f. sp. 'multigermtubi']|uniref:uncharacterized protein n=1 Tax=Drepanopeziza brunnea f. sp. 'multigermtubi' TaxID=698441 RepID=UPI002384B46B|nr:hypothetical protein L3040_001116 [Drepanopeziza brunnea f. sp. 'multigermtubi']